MRHIFVVLAWGPFLALAVPDLPSTSMSLRGDIIVVLIMACMLY